MMSRLKLLTPQMVTMFASAIAAAAAAAAVAFVFDHIRAIFPSHPVSGSAAASSKARISTPYMTKYERARILGAPPPPPTPPLTRS